GSSEVHTSCSSRIANRCLNRSAIDHRLPHLLGLRLESTVAVTHCVEVSHGEVMSSLLLVGQLLELLDESNVEHVPAVLRGSCGLRLRGEEVHGVTLPFGMRCAFLT